MPGKRRRDYERSATVVVGNWRGHAVAVRFQLRLFLNRACEFSRTLLE
jgi:hypothetical protein